MTTGNEYASVKAKGTPYDGLIRQEADRQGIPYDFMHKLIFNESSFNPTAKSPTGPLGLGQMTELTGKAYGLMSPADRMDPAKAIPAVARHLKDLSAAYKGDLLKAALAYNQGQGRLGSQQLAALDQGDFSKISPEGQNYMRKLLDVSGDSPSRQWFDTQEVTNPGINPKAQAVTFEEATQGVTAASKVRVGEGLPQLGNLNLDGGTAPETQQGYLGKPEKGFFEGTGEASKASVATSPIASIFRYATQEDHDPLDWVNPTDNSQWTAEDYDMIRKEGVDPQYFSFVQDYAKGKRANLPNAIAMAKENMEYERTINGAGTGAQIVGGFAGAGLDPLTYTPIPGATGSRLISRAAQGAMYSGAAAVASEGLRENMTGIEGHYGTALVGGALFGAGATALFDRALQVAPKAAPRTEMADGDLEAILARHGESALPNERIELHPDMAFDANDFAGPSIRLEARETARQLGMEDPSRFPWKAGEEPKEAFGVTYVDHPNEPGAVRLQDGSILSASNPLNPKTLKEAMEYMPAERAAQGVSMGGFTEIGYSLLRSESQEVRDIGGQLFRSPTGMQSGSNGRFGAVASDIVERIGSQDHVTYNKMSDQLIEAIRDPQYAMASGGRQSSMDMVQRRVAEAIEDQTGSKWAQLNKKEQAFGETVRGHYERKADMLEFPSQFGNANARAILPETRHAGAYIPNVYSTASKALHVERFGGVERLQKVIADSWMASYASRPHVKARVDKFVQSTLAKDGEILEPSRLALEVRKYANDKAYGVAQTDLFSSSSLLADSQGLSSVSHQNNFLEGRHLFDSDMSIMTADGAGFAVNDLREFDLMHLTPSYDRRVNGDIGIMGATGRSTEELLQDISKVKQASKSERAALEASIKILTQQARRDPEGAFATAARTLGDMSFISKSAYMGVQSVGEVASMVVKGHMHMLLKGVPILRGMTQWGSTISAKDLQEMHSLVFGRELDNSIRPRRSDIVERLRDQAEVNPLLAQIVGTAKYATGEASAISPFTKFLTESSNYIADAGRSGVLSNLVDHVLAGRQSKLFEPQRLHSMSISPEQFAGVKALIREHMVVSKDGKYTLKDQAELQRDPRSMHMWRLGDKIAHETILRPHTLSNADTVAYGAGIGLAMQFKKFVIRSVNSRLVRGYHDATKNGRAIDVAMAMVVSTGLGVSLYVAMKYSQAAGMPKDQREKFLKGALDPKMLAYAALSRSSHIGAPLGLVNIVAAPLGFDQAAMVRSSILPRGPKEQRAAGPMKYSPLKSDQITGFFGRVAEQIPAVGTVGSAWQVTNSAFGALGTDSRRADQEYMTGVFNGLRGLVPNDPVSQKLLLMMMEGQGVEIR
ncbi:transglycosylase SLT domain-containing protein [Pseudomonas chlororaphis]|uniref:transglycosylase SLT domain-containing protein n=1 Tax=Pseudomonas chlororaphis TaxID=587753 RepID=UPI000F58AF6E|nr:transglycosylase SLT domain-containing protein [Pseudomonas chlororaphis]AZD80960.1 Phage protein inside capsid D [Pseudomonas chlororaphis subsp. aurantiaca]